MALVGPSGSGKSTLLDIVAGLITQDSGAVRLHGQLTTAVQRLGRSAYMQQRDLLLPGEPPPATPRWGSKHLACLALDAERGNGTLAIWSRWLRRCLPGSAFWGMRQRAAFLRTILPRKELVLFDEPFGALDALTLRSASMACRLVGARAVVGTARHPRRRRGCLSGRPGDRPDATTGPRRVRA